MSKALFVMSVPLKLSLGTFACLHAATPLLAQVTSDGTLDTRVNQNGNVAEITGGETRGGNLFHSFQDFSVPTGNEAFFNNPNSISNIFSRVTGGNISNIDGLIRANNTNLFLINPAGIIFGQNARLDIGGSFYGSSASSILFEEGEFSAADLDNPPLLTVNAPIGLNFRDNPGDITLQGSNLSVSAGQNLGLLAGEILIDGSNLNATEGEVTLAALSDSGVVDLNENLDLNFDGLSFGDIFLDNGATINVAGGGGGDIIVNARNLTLANNSIFNAGIDADNPNLDTQAGNITVNASETVILDSNSVLRNNIRANSLGNAGDILITSDSLTLNQQSRFSSQVLGEGNGGKIQIDSSSIRDLR